MTRKALVVGIDHYEYFQGQNLYGCVTDARSVAAALSNNGDQDKTPNFDVRLLEGTEDGPVERSDLRKAIKSLFSGKSEIALFYFSGHGHVDETGSLLLASDAQSMDDGLSLRDVLTYADKSEAGNRVIILDSCFSGGAGTHHRDRTVSELKEQTTILTASTQDQYSTERDSGLFTRLMVDALNGAAANLLGEITPGSVYAHIDQALGGFSDQRPVFKTSVQSFVALRKIKPAIPRDQLRRLADLFDTKDYLFQLDPTFEPERSGHEVDVPEPRQKNTRIFSILQKYNRLNLLVPVGAPHMWHAAMRSKQCRLTPLGQHYWQLARDGKLK